MEEVDAYLQVVEPAKRTELERIRAIVRRACPDAAESISYGMPTFKYKGKPLVYYAAFKDHLSIFPTPGPSATLQDKLKDFATSKGTIKFTLEHNLSDGLVREIVQTRMVEIDSK
jgi:uncharacterized protein YdhG (YjbR/CyaY superfamily)